jgi:2-polyprenyl-6-methoxyphenol hydroxylase-like FAD-dependent oxidoreductase
MIGLPNEDESIMINLMLPLVGQPISFENIKTDKDFADFMRSSFPDAVSCFPDLDSLYSKLKISYLEDHQCYPFAKNNVCLIGDAAHTIQPYYG